MTTTLFDKPGELYLVKRYFGLWHQKHIDKIYDMDIYKNCDIFLKKNEIIMFLGVKKYKLYFLCDNKIAIDLVCTNYGMVYIDFVEKLQYEN